MQIPHGPFGLLFFLSGEPRRDSVREILSSLDLIEASLIDRISFSFTSANFVVGAKVGRRSCPANREESS
jgi:hypothetical protein